MVNEGIHQLFNDSRRHLSVDEAKLFQMVRYAKLNNWDKLLDGEGVNRLLAVDQGLEVFHFGYALENNAERVAC